MIAPIRRLLLLVVTLPFLGALPAIGAPLTAADEADVARIESYLNNISTLESHMSGAEQCAGQGSLYIPSSGTCLQAQEQDLEVRVVSRGGHANGYGREIYGASSTVECPAEYKRVGCSASSNTRYGSTSSVPYGDRGCRGNLSTHNGTTGGLYVQTYAFCVK